jgi:hypothetical protein
MTRITFVGSKAQGRCARDPGDQRPQVMPQGVNAAASARRCVACVVNNVDDALDVPCQIDGLSHLGMRCGRVELARQSYDSTAYRRLDGYGVSGMMSARSSVTCRLMSSSGIRKTLSRSRRFTTLAQHGIEVHIPPAHRDLLPAREWALIASCGVAGCRRAVVPGSATASGTRALSSR